MDCTGGTHKMTHGVIDSDCRSMEFRDLRPDHAKLLLTVQTVQLLLAADATGQ